MRKRSLLYPISFSQITDHPETLTDIFIKARPHKGAFIGVTELEGSFMCDSPEALFASLEIGEKLSLALDKSSKLSNPPLYVSRSDGTALGTLPYGEAIFPNKLISLGVSLWCHLEAKSLQGGLLSIAVSVYSEKY